jgi:hypothetical protein
MARVFASFYSNSTHHYLSTLNQLDGGICGCGPCHFAVYMIKFSLQQLLLILKALALPSVIDNPI